MLHRTMASRLSPNAAVPPRAGPQGVPGSQFAPGGYWNLLDLAIPSDRRYGLIRLRCGGSPYSTLIIGAGVRGAGSNNPNENMAVADAIATYCLPSTA